MSIQRDFIRPTRSVENCISSRLEERAATIFTSDWEGGEGGVRERVSVFSIPSYTPLLVASELT